MEHRFIGCDTARCTGCRLCEFACTAVKEGRFDLALSRLRVLYPSLTQTTVVACRFCKNTPCITACPRDALSLDMDSGIIELDKARCAGCGWCIEACPFGAIALDRSVKTVVMCDLCPDLPQPACVDTCPKGALSIRSTKKD